MACSFMVCHFAELWGPSAPRTGARFQDHQSANRRPFSSCRLPQPLRPPAPARRMPAIVPLAEREGVAKETARGAALRVPEQSAAGPSFVSPAIEPWCPVSEVQRLAALELRCRFQQNKLQLE